MALISMIQSNFELVRGINKCDGKNAHHSSNQIEIKRNLPQNSINFLIKYIKKIHLCQTKDF